jgi:hypothetical protein
VLSNVGGPGESEPFDINEYSDAAAEFSRTSAELRRMIESTSLLLASPAVDRATTAGDDVVIVAAWLAAIVIGTIGAVLGLLLVYRYLSARWLTPTRL